MTASATVARHLRALFVLACIAAGLAGCAGTHPPAPSSTPAADEVYKVGPLDSLNIVVWRNADLSGAVAVRPDGRISTPLVQDLVVAGKTPPEIARDIEKVLGKYVRDPNVTVLVTSFQGTFSEQIRIVGEAAKPQAIAYRQNMTLLDVMIQAGGLTDFADGNSAVLIRNNTSYTVRLKDLLKRGDITANAAMAPGDVIIVPQSWF
ncbi:MAG: XrtA/PEP-CTERM system exopolysaccharide export protein [Burkholderiaceae bacterium]